MSIPVYSIVVPVYNSSNSLLKLAQKVKAVFSEKIKEEYELIFVNDSPFLYKTTQVLEELIKNDKNIIVIELTKNYGQQAATLCGIKHAKGKYIITMDDDLQHNPSDIPLLLKEKEHDVVIAKFSAKKHSFFKRITSDLKGWFDYLLLGKPKHIKLTSFRLIKSEIAKYMLHRKTPYPFIPALIFEITGDVVNVHVNHYERFDGKTNYSLLKMVKLFTNLIINNSSFLLRIIGYLGFTIAIISFIFGFSLIVKKMLFYNVVVGWTSIIVLILFFGGMILFTLGIVGEYLIRIIATAENKPIYFIRHINRHE